MYRKSAARLKVKIVPGKASMGDLARSLGPYGLAIKDFVDAFNQKTKHITTTEKVIVTLFVDKNKKFTFKIGKTPTSVLIKNKLGLKKASKTPGRETINSLSMEQLREIAEEKMVDMGTLDIEKIIQTVIGTAKSMGIEVK